MRVNKQQSLFSDTDAAAAISHLLIYLALSCPSYLSLSLPPQSLLLMCWFFFLPSSDFKGSGHPAEELLSQCRADGSQETVSLRHDKTIQ